MGRKAGQGNAGANPVECMKPLTQEEAATLYFLPLLYMLEIKGKAPIVIEARGYVRDKGLFLLQMVDNETEKAYLESIYQYNKTWRLWGKRPTKKELECAEWKT